MIDVKVLGTGCAKCNKLAKKVQEVAHREGLAIQLEKVTDINDIMNYKIMMTPGLVINGEVKSSGQIPKDGEMISWLKDAEAN